MKEEYLTETLFKYWGFNQFKKPQKEVIKWVMQRNDAIALMPTGGGKSICYQLPSLLLTHPVLVISPLISLMDDQIKSLKKRNISCCALSAYLNSEEITKQFDDIQLGNYKIIFISPEKLTSPKIQFRLSRIPLSLISVDEAHCISQWGHDFRPSYLKINALRNSHPKTPFLALTGTASKQIQEDIVKFLKLKNEKIFKTSFHRKNIHIKVQEVYDKKNEVIQKLKSIKEKCIVYTRSRKLTEDISKTLKSMGSSSTYYHGGLNHNQRKENQSLWEEGENNLMIATSAFGMGINQADVRMIIHCDMPESIEAYYQEIGRAGRDGNTATALLVYQQKMEEIISNRIRKHQASIKKIQSIFKRLRTHFEIALGESRDTKFNLDLNNFCSKYSFEEKEIFQILKLLDRLEIIQINENQLAFSKLKIDRQIIKTPSYISPFLKNILRMYPGIVGNEVDINEFYIAKNLSWTSHKVKKELTKLNDQFILTYKPIGKLTIKFLVSLEDDLTINRFRKIIQNQYKVKIEQAYKMLYFAENTTSCRGQMLMNHFEENIEECGFCDICIKKKYKNPLNKNSHILEVQVLKILEKSDVDIFNLQQQIGSNIQFLKSILHKLREEKKIELNKNNHYALL